MVRNIRYLSCGAALLAGCAAVPSYYGTAPAPVYVERGEDGAPVVSATDAEIARLSTVPPVVGPPVVAYRPPYYAYPYYGAPAYGWPSTSLFFSWNNAWPRYPYRGWAGPPPRHHAPLPPPRVHAPPPAMRAPPVAVPAPSGVGRPPPAGGYRGMFGNSIGRKR